MVSAYIYIIRHRQNQINAKKKRKIKQIQKAFSQGNEKAALNKKINQWIKKVFFWGGGVKFQVTEGIDSYQRIVNFFVNFCWLKVFSKISRSGRQQKSWNLERRSWNEIIKKKKKKIGLFLLLLKRSIQGGIKSEGQRLTVLFL